MYKLVSFDVCPYVQRSVITLQEKGVPYEIEYIDLNNKPEECSVAATRKRQTFNGCGYP